jgi:hypothetical protein
MQQFDILAENGWKTAPRGGDEMFALFRDSIRKCSAYLEAAKENG